MKTECSSCGFIHDRNQLCIDHLKEIVMYPGFQGFSGEQCGQCKSKANVLVGPGWFCTCGHYNYMALSNHRIPWEEPDQGPKLAEIEIALENAPLGKVLSFISQT